MIKKGKVPLSQVQVTQNRKNITPQQTNKTQTRYKSLTVKEYSIGQGRFEKPPGSQGTFGSGIFFLPQSTLNSGFNKEMMNQSNRVHSIPHALKEDKKGQMRACESHHQQQIDIPPHPCKTIYKFDYNQFNMQLGNSLQTPETQSPKRVSLFQNNNQKVSKNSNVKNRMLKDEGTQPMSAMSMPSNYSHVSNKYNNKIRVRIDKVMEAKHHQIAENSVISDPKTVTNYPNAQHQQIRGSFEIAETEISGLDRQQNHADNQRVSNLQLNAQIEPNVIKNEGELKKVRSAKSAKTRVKAILNNKKSQGSICDANTPGGKNFLSPKFENIDEFNPGYLSQTKDNIRINLDCYFSQQVSVNKTNMQDSMAKTPKIQTKNVQFQNFNTIQNMEQFQQISKSTARVRRNF